MGRDTYDSTADRLESKFQLTRPRGARPASVKLLLKHVNFNSHAHVGRDYGHTTGFACCIDFNSHAHVVRDLRIDRIVSQKLAFQLTRPRGARLTLQSLFSFNTNFNSHAHVGRDFTFSVVVVYLDDFNSHAHVVRDLRIDRIVSQKLAFQLTRPRGARPKQNSHRVDNKVISTHTPTWGATLS